MEEERIQLENVAEFEKASTELIDKVTEVRTLKKTDRELNKLIKDDSMEIIDEYVEFEDLQVLLEEAERLKVPKKNANLTKLKELHAEMEPIDKEIKKMVETGVKKTKAREYLLKILKIGVS